MDAKNRLWSLANYLDGVAMTTAQRKAVKDKLAAMEANPEPETQRLYDLEHSMKLCVVELVRAGMGQGEMGNCLQDMVAEIICEVKQLRAMVEDLRSRMFEDGR